MTQPTEPQEEPKPAACPIDSKSHREHDEKIIELKEFQENANLPTRRLADRVVFLDRDRKRLIEKVKTLKGDHRVSSLGQAELGEENRILKEKYDKLESWVRDHMAKFHKKKA